MRIEKRGGKEFWLVKRNLVRHPFGQSSGTCTARTPTEGQVPSRLVERTTHVPGRQAHAGDGGVLSSGALAARGLL